VESETRTYILLWVDEEKCASCTIPCLASIATQFSTLSIGVCMSG